MERKRRFQTRAQYAEEKAKSSKFQKIDKNLNYLIGLVAVGIIVTLIFILTKDSEPSNEATDQQDAIETTDQNEQQSSTKDSNQSTNEETTNNQPTDENTDEDDGFALSENDTSPSDDPLVKEVYTNPNWPVYPTEQTGEHVSTFKKGDIDYEEKLKAIFSVTDLDQADSLVLRVGNNGNAQSAIAVIASKDKEKKYRVSIEWLDGQGWKPTKLEVLNSLEGAY